VKKSRKIRDLRCLLSPKNLNRIVSATVFFMGIGSAFVLQTRKLPLNLTPSFAFFSKSIQRSLSSLESGKREGGISDEVKLVEIAKMEIPGLPVPNHGPGSPNTVETMKEPSIRAESHPVDSNLSQKLESKAKPSEAKVDEAKLGEVKISPAQVNDTLIDLTKLPPKATGSDALQKVEEPKLTFQIQNESLKNEVCQSFEVRGESAANSQVSREEWNQVMDLFHRSKETVLGWLKTNGDRLPKNTSLIMEKSIQDLKIVQPAYAAEVEPDLVWRGVGVWVQDAQGAAQVLIGDGFLKLMKLNSKRAGFEMTRLVAQSWSPCKLARQGVSQVWSPLLKCLGEPEQDLCTVGSSVGSTWAVSSSIAAHLSAPECQLPAFVDEKKKLCLNEMFGAAEKPAPIEVEKLVKKEIPNVKELKL